MLIFLDGAFSCFCMEKSREKTIFMIMNTLDFIQNQFGKDEEVRLIILYYDCYNYDGVL